MTMIDQLSAILLLSILILAPLDAKKIGKDVFSCSPTSFTFGLNLNGKCPGMIEARPGIDGTDCYFIEDLTSIPTPVSVTQIQILELNLDLLTIYAKTLDGEFDDGYSWEYTSITAGELTDETELPGGIQLNIQGVDSNGVVVTNSIIIDYSNTADAYPILKIGDEIGWIVIMDLAPARAEYCPVVTEAPVTNFPDTEAPITEAPVTAPPTPEAPVTTSPAPEAPVTTSPAPEAPVTTSPAPAAPITTSSAPAAPMTYPPIATNTPVIDLETAFPTKLPMSLDYQHDGKGRGKKGNTQNELEGSKQKKSMSDRKKAFKQEAVEGDEKEVKVKNGKKR